MTIAANWRSELRDSLTGNMAWGINKAFRLAVLLGGFAVLLRILNGREAFAQHGATLGGILVVYFATATVCGALAGVVRPHLRVALVSMLLGGVAGLALGFSFHILAAGLGGWNVADAIFMLLCFLGGLGSGVGIWYRMSPTKSS